VWTEINVSVAEGFSNRYSELMEGLVSYISTLLVPFPAAIQLVSIIRTQFKGVSPNTIESSSVGVAVEKSKFLINPADARACVFDAEVPY
jgi:hypothetical protein